MHDRKETAKTMAADLCAVLVDRCKGEIEQEAYEVQDEWLKQYGTNMKNSMK